MSNSFRSFPPPASLLRQLGVLVFCLTLCGTLLAQTQVAQVSGTVLDPTGAAVPGAKVTITNVNTGYARAVDSDDSGAYVLPNLPVGTYRLDVLKSGFSAYRQTGIVLQVNTNPQINVPLAIGAETQSVEVQASSAMVETQSNGVGQVIDERRVIDLPLNGRNVTQLVALSGAAVAYDPTPAAGQSLLSNKNYPTASAFAVAGGQPGQTLFALDGAPHMDATSNVGLPMPMPDALQEFKVETSSLPANYGTQPGGVVNVVTKAGTNRFHGSAFEFVRNYALNAKNYFATRNDGLKRNQFGGAVGGPILHDKLFFFAGYQRTLENVSPAANVAFVATQAALAGDFTAMASPACNAGKQITLKAPFVNNKIPTSAMNPVALKFLQLLPLSTDPCGQLTYSVPSATHEDQETVRGDWQKSSKHTLFARYFLTDYQHPPVFGGNLLNVSSDPNVGLKDRVHSAVVGDTYTFGPHVISSFRASYSRSGVVRYLPAGVPTLGELGANVFSPVPNWLNVNVSGRFVLACTNCSPSYFVSNDYQIGEDLTIIRGRHQIAVGGSWIHFRLNGFGNFQRNGTFTFNGQVTGNGLADLIIGRPSSTLQSNGQNLHERANIPSMYVQDNVRVNPHVSLNVGLRWDPYLLPYNSDHQASIFDLNWFRSGVKSQHFTNAPIGTLFYGDPGMPGASYAFPKKANFSPRVGIVIDPRGKGAETIRAGFGIFYGTTPLFLQVGTHTPWANPVTLSQPAGGLSNPYQTFAGGNPFPTPNPPPANITFLQFGGGLGNFKAHPQPTYIEQWNLALQKQLPGDWLVSASYIGNHTLHALVGEIENPVTYVPGACVAGQYGLTAAGPCSTAANENFRRALILANPGQGQFYAGVTNFGDSGTGTYNGLLLSVEHRFAHNFSLLANHTWSHCLNESETVLNGAGTPQDPNNLRAEYGNCQADRRHIFNLSMVARTPKFSGTWVNRLAGGWQLSPILTTRTGSHATVATGTDTSLMGLTTRPNLTGNPAASSQSITTWFNTSAFTAPGPGQIGNVGRGTIEGPGGWNIDVALSRTFQVTERHGFDFRVESFNVLNHPQFNNPSTAMNSATFGRITSARDPRIMQLALKYHF
jgi:hypothetical protein